MKKKVYTLFLVVCVIFFVAYLYFELFLFPIKFRTFVEEASKRYGLDEALVYAIIKAESDFDKNAKSSAGALGLMQIIPTTAKWIAEKKGDDFKDENLFNEKTNIEYGCFYLRYLFDRFGEVDIVICAYNAGETKVRDWIENEKLIEEKIEYEETRGYLGKVRRNYRIYKNKELFE